MVQITLGFVILYGLIKFVDLITRLIDSILKLKEYLHKLKNHPDGSQSDSVKQQKII